MTGADELLARLEEGARDLAPYSLGEVDSPSLNVALPAYLDEAAALIRTLQADKRRMEEALDQISETVQITRARHIARAALNREPGT